MITATSSRVILRNYFTSCRRSHRKPDCSRTVRLLRVRVNLVFKREASSKSVRLVCKARAKDGHSQLVVIINYGEAQSAARSESG
jgi:hypothetical protein